MVRFAVIGLIAAVLSSASGAATPLKAGTRVVVDQPGTRFDDREGVVAGRRGNRVVVVLDRTRAQKRAGKPRTKRAFRRSALRRVRQQPSGLGPVAGGDRLQLPATPAPPAKAFRTVANTGELRSALNAAPAGGLIELAAGSYGEFSFDAARTDWVTVRPAAGASAQFTRIGFTPRASHIRIENLDVSGPVDLAEGGADHVQVVGSRAAGVIVRAGATDVLVEGNTLDKADTGVELLSVDCAVHNAPVACPANQTQPPIERVQIRNNRITAPEENGVTVSNFREVLVEGNDISGLVERGQHSDALQSLWGGSGLVIRHNFIHDMQGNQGIFLKDGRVSNVTVADNLIVRTSDRPGYDFSGPPLSFYDTVPDPNGPYFTGSGMRITGNTIWDNEHVVVIEGDENQAIYVHQNVFEDIELGEVSPAAVRAGGIDQDGNLIADRQSTWGRVGPRDVAVSPRFRNVGASDYRLAPQQAKALSHPGVNWAP